MADEGSIRPSSVARLLEEIPWEGATGYREGGRGRENVLNAEVLVALDFLPRTHFLGALIHAAHGADAARTLLAAEIEAADLDFLPGDMPLWTAAGGGRQPSAQPDALLTSPGVFLLIEAKRIRRSRFKPRQLAEELLAVMAHSHGRVPAILLLGVEPPVLVQSNGRMTIKEAVAADLEQVLAASGNTQWEYADLIEKIDEIFCWIAWGEVDGVVRRQSASFVASDPSVKAAVTRLAGSIGNAIAWHA